MIKVPAHKQTDPNKAPGQIVNKIAQAPAPVERLLPLFEDGGIVNYKHWHCPNCGTPLHVGSTGSFWCHNCKTGRRK